MRKIGLGVKQFSFLDMRLLSELFNRRFDQMPPGEAVGNPFDICLGHGMMIPVGESTGLRADYFKWIFR